MTTTRFQSKMFTWGLLLALFGCKTAGKESSNLMDSRNGRPHIVLVGQGGWGSCQGDKNPEGSRIYDSFKNLVSNLRNHADVNYLIGCLNLRSPALPRAPIFIEDTAGKVFQVQGPEEYSTFVKDFLKGQRADKVYFIGHSFGGWSVLNLLRWNVAANTVFALDPIDAESCTMSDGFWQGLGIRSAACERSPKLPYDRMLANAGKIVNLWQNQGSIHSTPIQSQNSTKVINVQIDVNHSTFNHNIETKVKYAHRMIGSYPEAWGAICHRIFEVNGFNKREYTMIDTDGDGRFKANVFVDVPFIGGDLEDGPKGIYGSGNNGGGGGGVVQPEPIVEGTICGQATQNTKVCLSSDGQTVTLSQASANTSSSYTVQRKEASQLMPGGTSYAGVADLSHLQGLSSQTWVAFIVHPNGNGRLFRYTQSGWVAFGNGGDFTLTGVKRNSDEPVPVPEPYQPTPDVGRRLCGQATTPTKVCINAERTEVTIYRNTGEQVTYQVTEKKPSQLLPGATAHRGTANLSFVPGLSSNQIVTFVVHPNGTGKLLYWQNGGFVHFGNGTPTFTLTQE